MTTIKKYYTIKLAKTIVVEVEADSREEAVQLALEDHAGSRWNSNWLHAEAEAECLDEKEV
jgi:hypothetical protein